MVYSTRRFVVCLTVCHFVFEFFSPFSIAITSLGEERANLSAFRMFVRFVLVWICRKSSSSWGLGRAAFCDCGTPWTFLLPFFFFFLYILVNLFSKLYATFTLQWIAFIFGKHEEEDR